MALPELLMRPRPKVLVVDRILIRALLASVLLWPFGCRPAVAPVPASVRRIAVLPPADEGASRGAAPSSAERSLADVLAAAARDELAQVQLAGGCIGTMKPVATR